MYIGIDSQCLSYVIDAMAGISEPMDSLASEKKALLRLYLYLPGTLYITPTVLDECAAIRDIERREFHKSFCNVLIEEVAVPRNQAQELSARYKAYHSGDNDCNILAEAVQGGLNILATYDNDFISHLRSKENRIKLDRPSVIWESMNIPRGGTPDKRPHPSNPLSRESWWQW